MKARLLVCFVAASLSGCAGSPTSATLPAPAALVHAASSRFAIVHAFAGAPNDGDGPNTLIYSRGAFYGTTVNGGKYESQTTHRAGGTIFRISPAGSESVLYDFGGGSLNNPPFYNSLVSVDGLIYGVDAGQNAQGRTSGLFYRLTPKGLKQLHAFSSRNGVPQNLTDIAGAVYGAASFGGKSGCGELIELSTGGAAKTVLDFRCKTTGSQPSSGVLRVGSTLYGTASAGGASGGGTVYAVDSSGSAHAVHAFSNVDGSGFDPSGGLAEVGDTLYGTLAYGGPNAPKTLGAVFGVTPSGTYATLFTFTNAKTQGSSPTGNLVYLNGKLYGTTTYGGANGDGTIFSLTLSGSEAIVHSFKKNVDGVGPGQLLYANGKLYGLAYVGPTGHGVVFSLQP